MRKDVELPIVIASSTEYFPETREKQRSDRLLPQLTLLSTEISPTRLTEHKPIAERPDPKLQKFLRDKPDEMELMSMSESRLANWPAPRTDIEDPSEQQFTTDKLRAEPKVVRPYTESDEPTFIKLRSDIEEASEKWSRMESLSPRRTVERTETELPSVKWSTTLVCTPFPRNMQPVTDRAFPTVTWWRSESVLAKTRVSKTDNFSPMRV